MNLTKSHAIKSVLVGLIFFVFHFSVNAQNGEQLFKQNCASCHAIDKDVTGPALAGVLNRGPWAEDKKNLYEWVHNPPAFMAKNAYTQALKAKYGVMMTGFPQLKNEEIDAIIDYVMNPPAPGGGDKANPSGAPAEDNSGRNAVIFGIISLILAIVALILMQVNSNLKKLSDDKEGILRPEPVPFYRNKIYIALVALILFVVGGYYVAKGAINLGRQKGYQPTQPIFFSHKVHAGVNQINCLYCHGGAFESRHAGIPTLNVCMNCHRVISDYTKGPKIYDEKGNEINGTNEIKKLREQYAKFNGRPADPWDPTKAVSPQWIKIHNLPDHVYFNHAQHTKVGNVQCQTCHGNIQTMDKVQQQAELSMGWCVNCHRQTKVNFNYSDSSGNRFYSLYEKLHNDIKSGKMDSVTVKDIGGLECQKCHY